MLLGRVRHGHLLKRGDEHPLTCAVDQCGADDEDERARSTEKQKRHHKDGAAPDDQLANRIGRPQATEVERHQGGSDRRNRQHGAPFGGVQPELTFEVQGQHGEKQPVDGDEHQRGPDDARQVDRVAHGVEGAPQLIDDGVTPAGGVGRDHEPADQGQR